VLTVPRVLLVLQAHRVNLALLVQTQRSPVLPVLLGRLARRDLKARKVAVSALLTAGTTVVG
jgi:hypothetical protein